MVINSPFAEVTIKPKHQEAPSYTISNDGSEYTLDNTHMETFFSLVEKARQYIDTMGKKGLFEACVINMIESNRIDEVDILNFRRFSNEYDAPSELVREALASVIHEKIDMGFKVGKNKTLVTLEEKFRPYV